MRTPGAVELSSVFFTVLALVLLYGCATSGVSPGLVPFHRLSSADGNELGTELSEVLGSIPVNAYTELDTVPCVVCRTADGYFLAPIEANGINTTKAAYLGSEPEQAFDTVAQLRQTIYEQKYLAQQRFAAAVAAGLASKPAQANTAPQVPVPSVPGGLGLQATQEAIRQQQQAELTNVWSQIEWSRPGSPTIHVRGYLRGDGTYVQPHFRSYPDGNFYNNWSTKGNVNPYTGERGTK